MKIYQVGGAVRDKLLGRAAQDVDYVVVGADVETMLSLGFQQVGKNFPVFLHPETKQEYALARKEVKIGRGHRDFRFIFDPTITLKEDLERRDFTCNAIAFDEEKNEYFDFYGGIADLKKHLLRHINAEHFVEDPLRMLRLCRFTAQLNFDPAPQTLALCRKMFADGDLQYLSRERIWGEFYKALQCPFFYRFLETAHQIGVLNVLLPFDDMAWVSAGREGFSKLSSATPKAKFAAVFALALKRGQSIQKIREIIPLSKTLLSAPEEFCRFALILCRYQSDFENILDLEPEKVYDLAQAMDIGGKCVVDDFLDVCRVFFADEGALFEKKKNCLLFYRAQMLQIKASDMPDFALIPKDQHFPSKLKAFKLKKILENLKHSEN